MVDWKLTSLALVAAAALGAACVQEPASGLEVSTGGSGASGAGNPTGTSGSTEGAGAGNPGGSAAKAKFINEVYPAHKAETAGAPCFSCHNGTLGPQYLTANAEGTYKFIDEQTDYITLPANSKLYLYGSGSIEHTGSEFTPAQIALVEEWLNMEAEERGLLGGAGGAGGGGTPTGVKTLPQALKEFGECMSLEDWTANELQLIQNTQVDGGERCRDCHSNGQNNTWLGADIEETFEMNRIFPYIARLVIGTVDEDGNFDVLVESKRFQQKGQEQCLEPPCHPDYELDAELVQGLTNFFNLTMIKVNNGGCSPDMGVGGGGGAGGGP